jgi:hypothetical protein
MAADSCTTRLTTSISFLRSVVVIRKASGKFENNVRDHLNRQGDQLFGAKGGLRSPATRRVEAAQMRKAMWVDARHGTA